MTEPDKVAQVVAGFLAPHTGSTLRTYRSNVDSWLDWCATTQVDPLAPTVGECRSYLDWWLQRSRSNSTVRLRVKGAAALIDHAIRYGATTGPNPWDEIKVPAPSQAVTTPYLTSDEQTRLIAWVGTSAGPSVCALVRLMAVIGLRVNEAVQFRIEDLTPTEEGWRYRYRAKGSKDRTITLDDETVDAIHAAAADRTSGFLFSDAPHDQPIDRTTGARWLAKACAAAGVTVVPPHGLRRSAITRILEATGDASLAQEYANHADIRTTVMYDKRRDRQAAGVEAVIQSMHTRPKDPTL